MARLAGRNKRRLQASRLAAAKVTTADLTASAVANATDLATALTLVNDLKAKVNANVTITNEIKGDLNKIVDSLAG